MSLPLRSTTADNPLAGLLATVVPLGVVSRDCAASDRRRSSRTVSPPLSSPHEGHDVASGNNGSPQCGHSAGSPLRWSGRRSRVRTQPRVARWSPEKPTKSTNKIVFTSRRDPLPGHSGHPGRPANADLDRREYPADSGASRADARESRRAGGAGAEDHPAPGDREGEPDDWPRGDGRRRTWCERVDFAATGEAATSAGWSPTAAPPKATLNHLPTVRACGLG